MRHVERLSLQFRHKIMNLVLVVSVLTLNCAVAQGQARSAASHPDITVDGNTTIFVGTDQPGPVLLAAKDLATDMRKVFGREAKIVHSEDEAGPFIIVVGEGLFGAAPDHRRGPHA